SKGVSLKRCESLSGVKAQDVLDFSKIDVAMQEGWIVVHNDEAKTLQATREGMLRLDALLGYILL
ncbi:MAG: hypothetical protein KAJ40_03765, partial [Alphaproteobacteria bacterium]|nr:hypothetical protein [Alphaproteobacteria bacterium]